MTIALQVVDQNTGNLITPPGWTTTAVASSNLLSSWTINNLDVHELNYWSPQSLAPNLMTSQGRLEILASIVGHPNLGYLPTFSQAAYVSFKQSRNGPDGTSTVVFNQNGVGSGPAVPSWTSVQGMVSTPPTSGYSSVAWSVGSYTIEGGKKNIYGLICTPTTGGPYPLVIYNHGGTGSLDGGNITGVVTFSGWTSQPTNAPDGLGQCLDWAKRAWVVAMSSYRGESVNITSASQAFPTRTWISDGGVEFCLGEVTDVLTLANLVVNNAGSITVGSASQQFPLNLNGKVFMYGYSHGGCITYRAVEQGAPVTSFSVIEGFTDINLGYLMTVNALVPSLKNLCPTPGDAEAAAKAAAATLSGACPSGTVLPNPGDPAWCAFRGPGCYFPDANG